MQRFNNNSITGEPNVKAKALKTTYNHTLVKHSLFAYPGQPHRPRTLASKETKQMFDFTDQIDIDLLDEFDLQMLAEKTRAELKQARINLKKVDKVFEKVNKLYQDLKQKLINTIILNNDKLLDEKFVPNIISGGFVYQIHLEMHEKEKNIAEAKSRLNQIKNLRKKIQRNYISADEKYECLNARYILIKKNLADMETAYKKHLQSKLEFGAANESDEMGEETSADFNPLITNYYSSQLILLLPKASQFNCTDEDSDMENIINVPFGM